ncbi:MAG: DUF1501 domain-containing protein [Planctomyces sp.]
MLLIPSLNTRDFERISRRSFLRIGGLGLGAGCFSEANLMAADAQNGAGQRHKSIIMVLLPGGPPHIDMYDLKPEAPTEIRGEFSPIETSVPGIQVSELMPRLASTMKDFVIVRSLCGGRDDHNVHQCLTGRDSHPQQGDSQLVSGFAAGGWPSVGAVVSKIQGPVSPALPAYISLASERAESMTRASLAQPGFIGLGHSGFEPYRASRGDLVLKGLSLDRLRDRNALLTSLDQFRAAADSKDALDGMDSLTRQAMGVLTSRKLSEALDLSREYPAVLARYGVPKEATPVHGGGKLLEGFVAARRLVESGARCVTLAFSPWPLERESRGGFNWDWHTDNFRKARATLPMFDQGITALVEDLKDRGLLDDVTVIAWGEFGRTPRINGAAGRDHWPGVNSCLMAGGGMKTGQTIGSTDRLAAEVRERPVDYREIFATLYRNVGIDAPATTLQDLSGRPQFLTEGLMPLPELY